MAHVSRNSATGHLEVWDADARQVMTLGLVLDAPSGWLRGWSCAAKGRAVIDTLEYARCAAEFVYVYIYIYIHNADRDVRV